MTHAVVVLENRMPLELALTKLKRQLLTRGVFRDMKTHAFYLKPGERRRLKSKVARKKVLKRSKNLREMDARLEKEGR